MAAQMTPAVGAFFSRALNARPATQPAAAPFTRQSAAVTRGFRFQSMAPPWSAPAMQATSTTAPNTKPSQAPTPAP